MKYQEDIFKEMVKYSDSVKDCCPICGHQFDVVQDINICPTPHESDGQEFPRDELIGILDDYLWCI